MQAQCQARRGQPADRNERDVVLARVDRELPADVVEQVVELLRAALDRLRKPVHALGQRQRPTLDEPVRVQQQQVAGLELDRRLAAARVEADADRRRAAALEEDRRPALAQVQGRGVAGARVAADPALVVDDHVGDRRERRPHGARELTESAEHGAGLEAVERVDAQRVAELRHRRRRDHALADDVADDDADPVVAEVDHVVPVAADLELVPAREVAHGRVDPLDLGQPAREDALLQRHGDLVLPLVDHHPLEHERRAVGGEGEQLDIVLAEEVDGAAADVHDAQHAAADGQRHADQRAAALAQVAADDLRILQVADVAGLAVAAMPPAMPCPSGTLTSRSTSGPCPPPAAMRSTRSSSSSTRIAARSAWRMLRTFVSSSCRNSSDRLRGQARLEDRLELVEPAAGVLGPAARVLLALVEPGALERLAALLEEHVDQGAVLAAQPSRRSRS